MALSRHTSALILEGPPHSKRTHANTGQLYELLFVRDNTKWTQQVALSGRIETGGRTVFRDHINLLRCLTLTGSTLT